MGDIAEILTGWGPLGCWVLISIWRETRLMARMDQQRDSFQQERAKWDRERRRWLATLGRKMGEGTIMETLDPD